MKNQLFPRKKMVLGRKTNFFLGKTTKKQKKHLLGHYAARHQKDGFLVFPRKKMVLDRKTNFFLGKRWFWTGKTNFFLGKRWFWAEKTNFFSRKNQKTHLLGNYAAKLQKDGFFGFP